MIGRKRIHDFRHLARLVLALFLLPGAWGLPCGEARGQATPKKTPDPAPAPAAPKPALPAADDESEIDWTVVIGIGCGVLFIGAIVVVALQQNKNKKKKSGGPAGDENIIGNYRLLNLMM